MTEPNEATREVESSKAFLKIPGMCDVQFESSALYELYSTRVSVFLRTLKDEVEYPGSITFLIDKFAEGDVLRDGTSINQSRYDSLKNDTLWIPQSTTANAVKQNCERSCFNCSEDHLLSECPRPIDKKIVAVNRRKHRTNAGSNNRFFDDRIPGSEFTPGKWSVNLREALGITETELPIFVYRMRIMGYPPGWLEETKIIPAMKIFNHTEGKGTSEHEQLESMDETVIFDPHALFEIPGFNVPIPDTIHDNAILLGMPQTKEEQSKLTAIQCFESKAKNSSAEPEPISAVEAKIEDCCSLNEEKYANASSSDSVQTSFLCSGTPVYMSRLETLPTAEKWRDGVAEHIAYENLPGATGTFDKMRSVLSKMKKPKEDSIL